MKFLLSIIISVVVMLNCFTVINFEKQLNHEDNIKDVVSQEYDTDQEEDGGVRG